ncbi:MAG TPA: helix-turn-helix domain-containing protein, partial [Ktedonobacteraceae bacterium]|nr:helix-turn-helix domain-containing protein [Ktedonobacteraceae bacterium]
MTKSSELVIYLIAMEKDVLAQQSQGANTRQQHRRGGSRAEESGGARLRPTRREARAQRILDAAAALILRWGYNKTTLDDISRQAGVAKGTLYLHWNTREELFAALMKREKIEMAEDIKQRIAGDPTGATLRGILKHSALALMKRPLMKAILLRDMDVIGKLAHGEQSSAAYAERLAGFTTYLQVLREQHLLRTDLSLRAQVYIFSAIFLGFFLVAPLMPDEFTLSDEEMAELMAETVHCTLEPAGSFPSEALQTASHAFLQYLNRAQAVA